MMLMLLKSSRSPSRQRSSLKIPPGSMNDFQGLQAEAIVDEPIYPHQVGRVRYQASWWYARCPWNVAIYAGDVVRVIGRDNLTLLVEPLDLKLSEGSDDML